MNKKIIDGVRQYYSLPNKVIDKQIAEKLKGSFGEAAVSLGIAKKNLMKVFGEVMPKVFKKYFKI